MSSETESEEPLAGRALIESERIVAELPRLRAWTVSNLRERMDVASKNAARLRRSYRLSNMVAACEVLAQVDDATVAACEALLKRLTA